MGDRQDVPRYLPFDGAPQSISMGLRPLDLADWLEVDERHDAELAAKAALLRDRRDEVLATTPPGDAASAETAELVVEDLRRRGLLDDRDERDERDERDPRDPRDPRDLRDDSDESEQGDAVLDGALHPLDAASRLVQEDLCVMVREETTGSWVLAAASVCAPSRWRLADKIGRDLSAIHGPVPHYDRIERGTNKFFDRIAVERPVWRTNWTILDDPALFQPSPATRATPAKQHAASPADQEPTADASLGDEVFLRVERQTLRRLPRTGAVLFTIRTYVDPLSALSARARIDLAATLAHVDPALVTYRGWATLLPAVRDWLPSA